MVAERAEQEIKEREKQEQLEKKAAEERAKQEKKEKLDKKAAEEREKKEKLKKKKAEREKSEREQKQRDKKREKKDQEKKGQLKRQKAKDFEKRGKPHSCVSLALSSSRLAAQTVSSTLQEIDEEKEARKQLERGKQKEVNTLSCLSLGSCSCRRDAAWRMPCCQPLLTCTALAR